MPEFKLGNEGWPAAPLVPENKESKEAARNEIVQNLRDFFETNNFKDANGNPVKLEDVYWPTPETEEAFKKIMFFLQSGELKQVIEHSMSRMEYPMPAEMVKQTLEELVTYLNEAT